MKKHSKFLLVMLTCITSIKAFAYDIEVENADGVTIYYNYINDGKELQVAYMTNAKYHFSGNINIPETVIYMGRTRKVTSIEANAFYLCKNVTSVTIPNSVITIGGGSFSGTSLTTIAIPNSVRTIGDYAFPSTLESIELGSGIVKVNSKAFDNNRNYGTKLKVIVKDVSVMCNTSINLPGDYTLYSDENTEITELVIPKGVKKIVDGAFSNCKNRMSVIIANDVESVGQSFNFCKIVSVFLGDNVEELGQTFDYCSQLESVSFGKGIKKIGSSCFRDCKNLKKVIVRDIKAWCEATIGSNPLYHAHHLYSDDNTEIQTLVIPEGVENLAQSNFTGCKGITSVILPNTLISIGASVFSGCDGLTSITIPNKVTSIKNYAFNCDNLATVVSLIEEPFSIESNTYSQNTRMNATLYVPKGTIDKYKVAKGWKDFMFIEEGTPVDTENILVSVSAAVGGTVSINGTITQNAMVKKGESVDISFVPNEGFELKEAKVGDKDVTGQLVNGTYTLRNVTEAANVSAVFAELPITLTVQHAENGCLRQVVNKGEQLTFQIVAATGWKVNTVTMDGQDVTSQLSADGSYTTPAIMKNASLNVSFESTNVGVRRLSASPVKVYANGSTLYIGGVDNGEPVSIYRADGTFVTRFTGNGDTLSTQLPTGQVYLVRTQDKTVKICM